jgi:hypothetical protein
MEIKTAPMMCVCGSEYHHFLKLHFYTGDDDYRHDGFVLDINKEIGVEPELLVKKLDKNDYATDYRHREPSITYVAKCELCGKINYFSLTFHKGMVYVDGLVGESYS